MKTPFTTRRGRITFNLVPTADRAFIWPLPAPDKLVKGGVIEVPEHLRELYNPNAGQGVLLAVGPGFHDKKGKFHPSPPSLEPGCLVQYDPDVPWKHMEMGKDGKEHEVVLCGVTDILAILSD